jgi:hypothetical protein
VLSDAVLADAVLADAVLADAVLADAVAGATLAGGVYEVSNGTGALDIPGFAFAPPEFAFVCFIKSSALTSRSNCSVN